ncbi:MAG: hypothetical protein QGI68_20645 [Pseudomonadales bacterium]|jgi:hypothetical protein|nr:hypothetical protein [Pseudomonadales bacterium]MDP7360655.1 hypothetical protein [Pseudomonadales bacterium]MDP7597955.1 hypothetical protein [Pseudomonadales bacterium]|tara:strand:+ start:42 stop:890 length:849 start_codon:yes stop_codon:yes gene_type:complete
MNKLYRLKQWYTLEDTAKHLTISVGEEIEVNDIFHLVIEEHLALSWYMRGVLAVEVSPATYIDSSFSRDGFNFEGFEPLSFAECRLEGPYRIDLNQPVMKDWVVSLIIGIESNRTGNLGTIVTDDDENLWQLVEYAPYEDADPFAVDNRPLEWKARKDRTSSSLGTTSHETPALGGVHRPVMIFPEIAELGVRRIDIDAFETALGNQTKKSTALSQTERQSLLKMILGMAISKYEFNPEIKRNHATGDKRGSICADLQTHGLSVHKDTIKKYMDEAVDQFIA